MLSRAGTVNTVGESFTVYKVADIDVSLPRRESKIGRGHKAFEVIGDPWLPPDEAARRRDFTVNAIAWDPLTGEYVDPFDGRADLPRRRLRMVDPRTFGDDSLRVLRGLQLAARFDLVMDDSTRQVCRRLPLDDLPAERVWGEIEKLLLLAPRPSIGLRLARDLGVVEQLFPELHALIDCPQEPEWHPEGDVWIHTLMVIDEARTRIADLPHPKRVAVMLGAVCHDLGKPATTAFSDGRIRSIEHEQAGVAPSATLLDRLERAHARRLRRARTGAGHCRPSPQAAVVLQGGHAGERWRVPPACAEGRPRAAGAGRRVGLSRPDWIVRLRGIGWFLERARALGVEHAPPGPLVLGRHLLALGFSRVRGWAPSCGRSTSISSMDACRAWTTESRWPGVDWGQRIQRRGGGRMIGLRVVAGCGLVLLLAGPAAAQAVEPIGLFAADARVAFPGYKQTEGVAQALGVETLDLPKRGLGLVFGAHLYPVHRGVVTLGIGGELMASRRRARRKPPTTRPAPTVQTRFSSASPQISLNFGAKQGWSYISGGLGLGRFTTELESSPPTDAADRIQVINYGGGARWFVNQHTAVSLDLRFYAINPQDATAERPAQPRMTILTFSAGVAIK